MATVISEWEKIHSMSRVQEVSIVDTLSKADNIQPSYFLRYLLLSIFLYATAVGIRLYSMDEIGLQSDERLWASRSYDFYRKARTDLRHSTSHLPHPGVTSAAVMAVGHFVREHLNEKRQCGSDKKCQVHILDACRISIVFFVSLLIPIMFLGTIWLIGPGWAFLAALLVSMDPRVIGYTRIAHIDGTLALFVCATLLTYLNAMRRDSNWWRFISGICWGCCLLTKPTGALVLPVLVCYRVIRWIRMKCHVPLIEWKDIWLVVLAHFVFVAGFTRLWDLESHYTTRLHVESRFAHWVLEHGLQLQQFESILLIVALGVAFLTTALFFCWRQTGSSLCYHSASLFALLGVIGGLFSFFPVILRNLILYWTWVSGLSGVKHEAFGKVKEITDAPGYVLIVGTEIPEAIIVLFVLGVFFFMGRIVRSRSEESLALLSCLLIAVVFWVAFLGASSKQALRYVLPVIPFIYVFAVYALRSVARLVDARLFSLFIAGILCCYQGSTLMSWQPYVHTYFNRFIGGLPGAHDRGRGYLFAGQIPAVEYFVDRSIVSRQPLYVTVVGDMKTAEGVLNKFWPEYNDILHFGFYPPRTANYVLMFPSHKEYVPEMYKELIMTSKPVFTVPFQNTTVAEVYELLPLALTERYQLAVDTGHRLTGDVVTNKAGIHSVRARLGVNPPGYIYFNDGIRLSPGTYALTIEGISGHDPVRDGVLRLELTKNCSRVVNTMMVNSDNTFSLTVLCTLEKNTRVFPRVYWYGETSVSVNALYVDPVPDP